MIDRLVFDAVVRHLHLGGVAVNDPQELLPRAALRVGLRDGVELFWPAPRREVARWVISFALLLLAVLSLPVGACLYALARAYSPGASDLGTHFAVMSGPVITAVALLTVLIGIASIGQLADLGARLRRSAARVELESGERLLAVCVARAGRGKEGGREPWAERVKGLLRFDWGAFLAITDRRLLRFAARTTTALVDRSEVVAVARTPRGDERSPLVAAVLQAVGQTYELLIHVREGEPIVLTAECLFFESLVDWLAANGFRVEGIGWVPDPPDPQSDDGAVGAETP